jgi:capsular polysaccharide biosynthesis protein
MEISLEVVLKVLRKSAAMMIVFALCAALGAFLVCGYLVEPTYVASTQINLIGNSDANIGSTLENNNSWVFANKLAKTCASILTTNEFAYRIKSVAGVDYKPSFSVSSDEDTTVLSIKVMDHNPENAYKIACAIADSANDHLKVMTKTSVEGIVIEKPVLPSKASSPDTLTYTLIAAIAVAVIVFVIQLLRELLGKKIKDETELSKRYGIPVIASIPDFNEAFRHSSKYAYSDYYTREEN